MSDLQMPSSHAPQRNAPENPAPLITTYFCIAGRDFDLDACTGAIGLSPTKVWHQTHRSIDTEHPELPNTNWTIELADRPLYSIDEGLAELFQIIWPARERIRDFLHSFGLKGSFGAVATLHVDRPLWELKPDTLGKLAWFGCEWGLDIFDYRE